MVLAKKVYIKETSVQCHLGVKLGKYAYFRADHLGYDRCTHGANNTR